MRRVSRQAVVLVACTLAAGAAGAAASGGAAAQPPPVAAAPADIIFVGGAVVTMDPARPRVEAVAVRGETIVAAGMRAEATALRGEATRVVELGARALLPGFIDAHGHFLAVGRGLDACRCTRRRSATSTTSMTSSPESARGSPSGTSSRAGWSWAAGTTTPCSPNAAIPPATILDRASTEHRIVLTHVSGHLRAANSAALAAAGVTAETPDPPGGHIRRRAGSREPDGVLEERAGGLVVGGLLAAVPGATDATARRAIEVYLSYGTTTIQDGATGPETVEALRAAARRRPFDADVAAFPRFRTLEDAERAEYEAGYSGGFRVAGVKFSLDGSPQGRTAWVTRPYDEGPPGAPPDYRAYGTLAPELYKAGAARLIRRGVPIIVHANGDAAIDLMLDGVAEAVADVEAMPDHRAVIIHAQLMRADQLDRAAELRVVPSFFSAHAFFWGDWHLRSFGAARGSNISPARWAIDRGVRFTMHNDAPIVPPDIMRLVSIAVNRTTRSGRVLGPEQRATVREALHAVTLGAAYQYFEEDAKGSITAGKQADLVILERNPLTADARDLEHLRVLETFSRGRSVFRLPAD